MKSAAQHIRQRYILLVTLFLLLVITLVLVYTHPDKKNRPDPPYSTYENSTVEKWHSQLRDLLKQQDYANAELMANNIQRAVPDDIFSRRALICCKLAKNDPDGAIEMCRKILLSVPDDAITRNNLAVLLNSTSPGDAANAAATALELAPENRNIRNNATIIRNRAENCTIQCDVDTLLLKVAPRQKENQL